MARDRKQPDGRDAINACIYNPREFRSSSSQVSKRVRGPDPRGWFVFLAFMAIVVVLGWLAVNGRQRPSAPLPASGMVILGGFEPSAAAVGGGAPLRVEMRDGQEHCLVKLEDWHTGRPVVGVFVRAGETAEVVVPLGTYRMKVAYGLSWYGVPELFGVGTQIEFMAAPISFERTGSQVLGKKISLVRVEGGNLRTYRVGREEFWQ